MSKSNKKEVVQSNEVNEEVTVQGLAPIQYDPGQFKSKSEAIRFFLAQGHKRADIARAMGVIYQFVNNIYRQPVKRSK